MDQALAIAEATLLAGMIAAIAQERFLSKWEGKKAFLASVALSLAVGIAAVARTGGLIVVGDPRDPFAFAASVLASAGVVLAASQAAFRVIVRPITKPS